MTQYTSIYNWDTSPFTLPAPYRGVLKPGSGVVVAAPLADVRAAFVNGVPPTLSVVEGPSTGYTGPVSPGTLPEAIVDLQGAVRTVYVNSDTGSDVTGLGTEDRPYQTVAPTAGALYPNTVNGYQRILLSGTATHILPTGWTVPVVRGSFDQYLNLEPTTFSARAALVLEADPIPVATYSNAQYSAVTLSSERGRLTIPSGTFAVDALKHYWFKDADGNFYYINGNTATTVDFVGLIGILPNTTIEIYRHGATIAPAEYVSATPVLRVEDMTLAINGVHVQGDVAFAVAIDLTDARLSASRALFTGGIASSISGQGNSVVELNVCGVTEVILLSQATFSAAESYLGGVTFYISNGTSFTFRGLMDSASSLGSSDSGMFLLLVGTLIGSPIEMTRGSSVLACDALDMISTPADAITVAAGRAYLGGINGGVTGSGITGLGLVLKNGAQVEITGGVSITGTGGGWKVGSQAAVAPATFRTGSPPYNKIDTGGALSDLSRLYQPT